VTFPTCHERDAAVVRAPDSSEVRPLVVADRGSLATFHLAAGQVSAAVAHRSVEEVWYVVAGRGHMWRAAADAKEPDHGEVTVLEPGVALALPVGTRFQFRAEPDSSLHIVGVTMPPWPGDDEAVVVEGRW
jgi:mannose-6-phosphate isomerase-like protein (cupin superfamily)